MSLQNIKASNEEVNLEGKSALVVGATAGIGKGIALRLARARASVTITGRNQARGDEVVQEMTALSGANATHAFVKCDGSSLAAIRGFTTDFCKTQESLEYLVLTQGIATKQGYTPTTEGLDQKLAIHYFGRMGFVQGLLPLLNRTAGAADGEQKQETDVRVMSVLSGGVHQPYKKYKSDFELKRNYSLTNAANSAGFYTDLALDSLAKENPKLTFIHAAPGFINSNWGTELPWYMKGPIRLMQKLGRSTQDCGEYMCHGLFSPAFKGGFQVMGEKGTPGKPTALHNEAREFVWAETARILQAGGAEQAGSGQ
mmetsp:Transcript_2500/g.2950  ORF Transcript_2500/g.2950 Transcript_2500/m.2950 type:complete len:313 (+) Transcript_2500:51-989(+)|eukprot:CAMPEP_0205819116 /NCGR_PEP_ID=MMETSP0206-20130828/1335_1 /ASSEMBLY_ACC=CAM_ASM_000279 /TAXON_ID=36767 /ORGANISM="Euplotes focardii, Strain TN1" /LENGTH=312 /DNA_ID=CAMNT_0053112271 /DNA_START=51 /DNA_END=989 /DNA_ORIENTATION=+